MTAALAALCALEGRMIARRAGPPAVAAAVAEALAACGGPVPERQRLGGARIAEAVEAHGRSFPPGAEPAYHDRHHQAEATLAAAWLVAAASAPGAEAGRLCVLAMAGHDLLHDGRAEGPPGALEALAAAAALAACPELDHAERAEIGRLILLTDPSVPEPADVAGRLVREADLFGSLTPWLGWRLSEALARERAAAGLPRAAEVASFSGRAALLARLPGFTPAAEALGLGEAVRAQRAAFAAAGRAASPEAGARALDAQPRAEAMRRLGDAFAARGLGGGPR